MKVLHIDRSRFFQKIVKEAGRLEAVDYVSSVSIKDAWTILEKESIDLILTGQEFEDGSADTLLQRLEDSAFSHVPVIVITSNDSLEVRESYFNRGVVDFIQKSDFTPEKLKEHLDHFKRQDQMISQLRQTPIAILDDSRLSLNVISSILKIHKIEDVDTYTDPEDLLKSERDYDIYFVDMMLPKITGEKIVVELRRRFPHAVILVISSLDKYNTIVHVLESGADDYMIKPFDARLLMARLKSNFRHFLVMGELKQRSYELKKMAITDSLTNARNHRYLFNRLDAEIAHAERHQRHLCVLLLDIDKFKAVNDDFGHPMGDVVLKELSQMFMTHCRKHDIFGRYGGEEFMLILPDTDLEGAFIIGERMRERFEKIEIPGIDRKITFSGGLVEWRGESNEDIIKRVDELLYCAKNEGRNRIKTETDPFCS